MSTLLAVLLAIAVLTTLIAHLVTMRGRWARDTEAARHTDPALERSQALRWSSLGAVLVLGLLLAYTLTR